MVEQPEATSSNLESRFEEENIPADEDEAEVEELSSDEEEADYSKMPSQQ